MHFYEPSFSQKDTMQLMTNSYSYLVKFIPTGKFFFGGEIGHKGRGRSDEALTSYIVRSQLFPQQTTLLGALRYAVWKLSGEALENAPIGDKSFHLSTPEKTSDFGCIKNLSELFIYHNKQFYWQQPLYNHLTFDGQLLQGFDHKKTSETYFAGAGNSVNKDALFKSSEQVGVITYASKKRWQIDEEDAFYRQTFYQFKSPEDGFAFLVNLDESKFNNLKTKKLLMPVGGENSIFNVSIDELPKDFKQPVFRNSDAYFKIILTSDALLTNELVDTADFAVTDTVDFRFLNTNRKEIIEWNDLQEADKHSPSFSQKHELFARGAVFYFKNKSDANKLIEGLEKEKAMRQIGYNQYISQ